MRSQVISKEVLQLLLPASRSFIPSLNGLRAVSICIVLLDHAIPDKIIPGGLAVSVFFFISGFLITRLILNEYASTGKIDLKRFYVARAFRLFPALAVALLYAISVTYILHFRQSTLAILSVVFYFANYLHGIDNSQLQTIAMNQAWSLAVEEHFYLVYPAVMLWCLGSRINPIGVVVIAIVISASLRVIYHFNLGDISSTYIYCATETRMDFIAYGCLAALICNSSRGRSFIDFVSRPPIIWTAGGMILLSLINRESLFRDTVRYYLQGAGLFILIPAVIFGNHLGWLRGLLNLPLVDWIGRISYSLYLFHFASFYVGASISSKLFENHGIAASVSGILIGLLLSIVLANASYIWIEQPFLRLRGALTRES